MQTKRDTDNLAHFGLPNKKLQTLGNLKFDTGPGKVNNSLKLPADLLPKDRVILICGSTHSGEEKILIDCYRHLKQTNPELFLIIAPRDTTRSAELQALATKYELTSSLRSENSPTLADIFILDTIGELVHFYALSNIGFVGGSLVEKGGHNPIEPAIMGLPVIFGPNMQDFCEIAEALIKAGGATEVSTQQELVDLLHILLTTEGLRNKQGRASQECIERQRGVIDKHLELISQLL